MDELFVCMFNFCMNLMYVIRCRLYFISDCLLLQTKCRLCVLSSSNECADVSTLIATVDSSSDGQMMSAHPSLLGATVAMNVFCLSLLSYHCSDDLVVTDWFPVTTVTYNLCYSD
jgi:hypothetical protein